MNLSSKKCIPCRGSTPPLSIMAAEELLKQISDQWELIDTHEIPKIRMTLRFDTYMDGVRFLNRITEIAEEQQHHPILTLGYKKVTITLYTFAIKGLSENDFIMAAKIDTL